MDGGSTEDAGGGPVAGLGGLERWWAYLLIAGICLVLCGSVLLNSTLLVAFFRRPGLRTISNRLVHLLLSVIHTCKLGKFSLYIRLHS